MYTSGSTGMPKGAVMSHANLLWFIQWSQDRFEIGPNDILTNVNPIYFDNSVFDFFSALFSGACLVPFTQEQVQDVRKLVSFVEKAKCTIWFSVPSLLVYLLTTRSLTRTNFTSVRKIIFGGEGFPKAKLKQLYDLFGDRVQLENVYGPTECTCICSAYTISAADFDDMQNLAPLGILAQNFDFEILNLEDTSDTGMGELFLRGPQVGLGYYNDVERTQRAFIQNPKQAKFLELGYRTGDLVQLDARGFLHFKGRVDFQIKHMGYRIELEEITAKLNKINGIESSIARVYSNAGRDYIIAYLVSRYSYLASDSSELQGFKLKLAGIRSDLLLATYKLNLDLPENKFILRKSYRRYLPISINDDVAIDDISNHQGNNR